MKLTVYKTIYFFVFIVMNGGVFAQLNTHRTGNWIPNSTPHTVVYSNGYTMLSGYFDKIGPYTGGGAVVDAVTDSVDLSMPKINGSLYASLSDGAGGVYIGGSFSFINNFPIKNLAHIKADKTLDTLWTPNPDGDIEALAMESNTLYVGGSFQTISLQARNRIAAFTVSDGNLKDWHPTLDNLVTTISVNGNSVYVGGSFTTVEGQPRNKIAAIDAVTGLPTAWAPSITGTANSITVVLATASTIYIGGYFTAVGGSTRMSLAAISTDGTLLAWNPNVSYSPYLPSVSCLLLAGDIVYIGGTFTSINGGKKTVSNLAAVNATSGVAINWSPTFDYSVSSFVLSGSTLYVGGYFTTVNTIDQASVAAISTVDGSLLPWNPRPSNGVSTLSFFGNNIFLGGYFIGVNWIDRNGFALLHDATDTVWPYSLTLDGQVYAMAIQDNTLYIGGSFSALNTKTNRKNLAAIDLTTGKILPWSPAANGTTAAFDNTVVKTLKIKGNLLYVGGIFLNINNAGKNTQRPNLAALDLKTGEPSTWNPVVGNGKTSDQYVNSIDIVDSTLYVGGSFNLVGGQARTDIAAVYVTNGNVLPWAPVSNGEIRKVRVAKDVAYVVGDFANGIGGAIRLNNVAALDLTTAKATSWNPDFRHGSVVDIALSSSDLYTCGYYDSVGMHRNIGLASFALSNGDLNPWDPDIILDEGGISTIDASPNRLHVAGSIGGLGNERRYGYAEYDLCPSEFQLVPKGSELYAPTADTYQWYKDGSPIPGATGQRFEVTYLENGTYFVELTVNSCTGKSNDFIYIITGQIAGEPSLIKIFPNPVKEELFIEVPKQATLTIRTIMGETVINSQLGIDQTNRIETHDLKSGTFILTIQTGNTRNYFKILKLH